MQGRVVVIGRHQHQLAPAGRARLDRLAQQRGHDVDHRMIGRLTGARIALGRIANDAEGRLIGDDADPLDRVGVGQQCRLRASRLIRPSIAPAD